jgi:tetratricopeptide (TPR) repeat protein
LVLQSQQLALAAQQAMQAGRLDEAARLWGQVLALQPEHPQALFHLGQHKLLQRDTVSALALLERAARADPKMPAIPLNIAFAHRSSGNTQAELAALDHALAIDPYFFPALLAKGEGLRRQGRSRTAAKVFKDALAIMPPEHRLPEELKAAAATARAVVQKDAAAMQNFLSERLTAVSGQKPGMVSRRLEECVGIAAGTMKTFIHRPTMLNFPQLPAIALYERGGFPWLPQLEQNTETIRNELLALLKDTGANFVPYVDHADGAAQSQWGELNRSPSWGAYFLWDDGRPVPEHMREFPQTTELLRQLPLADVPGAAPNVFFSLLKPGTHIPPHTGVTNTRLIVHLPLMVPEGCWFRVGNETREVRAGEAWVFDDTIEHEAKNESDQPRIILIFDVWNPHICEAERPHVAALVDGITAYYREE